MPAVTPTYNRLSYYGLDRVTKDWISRVTRAANPNSAGTLSSEDIEIANDFIVSARDNGFFSKIQRVNLFIGQDLGAILTPLICQRGYYWETNSNFAIGDYSRNAGLTGNGSDKHLRTGLCWLGAMAEQNTHLAIYINAFGASNSSYMAGVYSTTTYSIGTSSDTNVVLRSYDFANNEGQLALTRTANTLYCANRTASADYSAWKDLIETAASSPTAGGATTTGAAPNIRDVALFANNNAGTVESWSTITMGGYSMGYGMTDAQYQAFYAAMIAALRATLGR